MIVATKIDALDEPERLERLRERANADGRDFYAISAVTNKGVRELVQAVSRALDELKANGDGETGQRGDAAIQQTA